MQLLGGAVLLLGEQYLRLILQCQRRLRVGRAVEAGADLDRALREAQRLVVLSPQPQHEGSLAQRELRRAMILSERRYGFLQRLAREQLGLLEVAALEVQVRLLVEPLPFGFASGCRLRAEHDRQADCKPYR